MSVKRKKSVSTQEPDEETLFLTDFPVSEGDTDKDGSVQAKGVSSSSLEVNYDEDSIVSNMSSISYSKEDDSIKDLACTASSNSSRYRIARAKRIRPSNLNNFLDFISMCFWKCSTGCQQLPDKHY